MALMDAHLDRLLACDPVRCGDLEGFPREPGVYAFYDDGGQELYVGKAANALRDRMREHAWPSAERATRRSKPFCTLAIHLAEEGLGRPVEWPRDKAAVLEALVRVRHFQVRYVVTPDLETYVRQRLRPKYGR